MSNLSKEQREVLALIDAILAMTEKNPEESKFGAGISLNPFEFLIDIISKKVSFDEMLDWLVKILTESLPYIELGVKGILLANLKATIDCNNDPRIPNWIRKDISGYSAYMSDTSINKNGFLFNLKSIDYRNILSVSPLSDEGNGYYFGTRTYYTIDDDRERGKKFHNRRLAIGECAKLGINISRINKVSECDNVYKLARADDFNAFLWFVVHKGFFPIKVNFSELNGVTNGENALNLIEGKETLTVSNKQPSVGVGNYIKEDNTSVSNFVSLCIETETAMKELTPIEPYDDEFYNSSFIEEDVVAVGYAPREYSYKIVPVSSDNLSVNWYVNSGTFFNFLKKEEDKKPRDYNEEYPICNLQYLEKVSGNGIVLYDNLRFTILPKPFVHLPHKGEPIWKIRPILFDDKGEPTIKGRYSVLPTSFDVSPIICPTCTDPERVIGYTYSLNGGGNLFIDADSYEYYLDDTAKANLTKVLYECYPRLTVYEFNYDFVMGMQLFDPTVVASQLIETIINLKHSSLGRVGFNVGVNKTETAYQMRVSEIVKNIIESTAYEVSDCFYSFDNSKYDSMLRAAELKRSRLHINNDGNKKVNESSNEEIIDILNEFDNNATLNENKEVIKRAITKATATITNEVLPEDKYSIEFNIVQDLIKSLVVILVDTFISPKIVLLYEVNRHLMGQDYSKYNIEDFLKSIEGLLISIVKELRDLILQQLLDWCMSILMDLFSTLKDLLIKEQLEYYSRLMKALFKACSFKASHRAPLESKLDHVDYADIDEIERPQESNC